MHGVRKLLEEAAREMMGFIPCVCFSPKLQSNTACCSGSANSCLIYLSRLIVVFGRRAKLISIILAGLEARVPQYFLNEMLFEI